MIQLVAVFTAVHVVPLHSLLGLAFGALPTSLFPGLDVKVQVVLGGGAVVAEGALDRFLLNPLELGPVAVPFAPLLVTSQVVFGGPPFAAVGTDVGSVVAEKNEKMITFLAPKT